MTTDRPKRLTEAKARAVADAARIVKAPSWSTTREWDVEAEDGAVLLVVVPAYRAGSRGGWTYRLEASAAAGRWPTREAAAVQGLMAWIRWVTAPR
ncbi:hypothetical protein [Streptomyces sp. Wb2n-11]|uniref:hypothetical protein n=1 Tax=Streptomyces sp. Wb2n-11 TaxID=1030533 RepID=UPI000B8A21F5|nr:hypothetical protein [Streptomyces sp. Wb2n-11]